MANKQFKAGTLAYWDAFRHVPKCVVMEVIEPGTGRLATSGKLKIKIAEDTHDGAYKKGEVLEVCGYDVFPRVMQIRKQYSSTINPNYEWIK